jgi:protein-tyrosine phosphatase
MDGVAVLVSMLTEDEFDDLGLRREAEECERTKIRFVNLPIPHRSVPPNKDRFLRSVDQLAAMVKQRAFLGVHCRASIGRSSIPVVSS